MNLMIGPGAFHDDHNRRLSSSTNPPGWRKAGPVSIIVFSALLIFTPCEHSQSQSAPGGELTAGVAAEKAGRYEEAAAHYRKALAAYPASPLSKPFIEIRTRLATALFMLHRYDESLQVLAPLPFARSNESSIPAQTWTVRGLDELDLNQLGKAVLSLRRAVELNPDAGTARLALGDALVRSGATEAGAEAYREQLRRTPDVAEAWYKLGLLYDDLAQKLDAALSYKTPQSFPAADLAAQKLYEQGDFWGAARTLWPFVEGSAEASRLATSTGSQHSAERSFDPGLRAHFGETLLQLGYPHAAESEFRAELSQDMESFPAWFGLMELVVLQSNWELATQDLQRLIALYPKALARRLESPPPAPLANALKEGRIAVPASLSIVPEGKLLNAWLGSAGLESPPLPSEPASECPAIPTAQQREPGYWLPEACARRLLADLRSENLAPKGGLRILEIDYRLGDYEAARSQAIALRRVAPENPWIEYWQAKTYSALAGECLQRLAKLDPDSVRVHELLGRRDSDRLQLAEARKEYEAALRLAPELPDLHLGLGTVYWQIGDWARAENELKRTLQLSPGSAVAAYELGDSYLQQGEWKQASENLRPALGDAGVARRARLDLAKAEAAMGQSAAAIQDLLQLAPGDLDGEAHYRLATLYRQSGETAKAQQALADSERLRKASDELNQQKLQALEHEKESLQQINEPQ